MRRELDFDGEGPCERFIKAASGKFHSHGVNKAVMRKTNIGVIDFETDQFDNTRLKEVFPFLVIVYSDQFAPIIIWDNNWRSLIQKLYEALEQIEVPFTFYAHNGGRFDFMFLMHLITGDMKFKGRSLMKAKFGKHELRDSLHIIPGSLKNANRKLDIDYNKFDSSVREQHKKEITDYCLEDCVSLFEAVRSFVNRFGMPLTIGQAAMTELRKHYPKLKQPEYKLDEPTDRYFRQWFFGGRVECIARPGLYNGPYKVLDVNSMYLSVMCHEQHPICSEFMVNDRITKRTAFIHLRCQNRGALVARGIDGSLTALQEVGEFWTTIHEFKVALELGLVRNVQIIKTIDFREWSDFSKFGLPLYSGRQEKLRQIEALKAAGLPEDKNLQQSSRQDKDIGNNAYGKFAQNPRRFKDHYILEPGHAPPKEWLFMGAAIEARRTDGPSDPKDRILHLNRLHAMSYDEQQAYWQMRTKMIENERSVPSEETNDYWIWSRPSLDWRFNNVATAASITGAARAKLLRAKHFAIDPLYCDTDSLICRDLLEHQLSNVELGAWKLEAEIREVIVAGKKLYGYHTVDGKEKIRAKGMQGVTWADLLAILDGKVVRKTLLAPTITRLQTQHYMTRELRMTA